MRQTAASDAHIIRIKTVCAFAQSFERGDHDFKVCFERVFTTTPKQKVVPFYAGKLEVAANASKSLA